MHLSRCHFGALEHSKHFLTAHKSTCVEGCALFLIEWCVVTCGSKNRNRKGVYKQLDHVLKNLLTILGSIVNIIEGTYVTLWLTLSGF